MVARFLRDAAVRTLAFALAMFAALSLVQADQSNIWSPTTGTVSGLNLSNNLNGALNALNTCNSGASAPANQLSGSPALGNCWIDTSVSPKRLKYYDGTSWLIAAILDDTNHLWVPVTGGGAVQSIASAGTTDLCSANQNFPTYVSITGTTTITAFGSNCQTGQVKIGVFTGALTLTHNGASLILPFGGGNTVTAAGDTFAAVHLGSGNWRVTAYQRAAATVATVKVQTFSASGTYTPCTGLIYNITQAIGGGGGGGGTPASGAGQVAAGGGGGGGGLANGIFSAATIGSSQTVTIGAAGTNSAGLSGGNGGNTTFGALLTANGGAGGALGTLSTTSTIAGGASGGTASGGYLNTSGATGGDGWGIIVSGTVLSSGGTGAPGLGGAWATVAMVAGSTVLAGVGAVAPGGGGSGAATGPSQSQAAGGPALAGRVVVTEYCNQ